MSVGSALHVLTLFSDKNEFGGPVRVAINLAKEQKTIGIRSHIFAMFSGQGKVPTELESVPATFVYARRFVPKLKFSGLSNLRIMRLAPKLIEKFEILHIHLARDLFTLPIAFYASLIGKPYVIQSHGMIGVDNRISARVLDFIFTKKVLKNARYVLALTEYEKKQIKLICPQSRVELLPNGVPIPTTRSKADQQIVFAARLHHRKNPLTFVQVANNLKHMQKLNFRMFGADEGEKDAVESLLQRLELANIELSGPITHSELMKIMSETAVFVLPSVEEPFPVSILEAISYGVPVVITRQCGLASIIESGGAGVIVDPNVEAVADAILKILKNREDFSVAAKETCQRNFSIQSVTSSCVQKYEDGLRMDRTNQ